MKLSYERNKHLTKKFIEDIQVLLWYIIIDNYYIPINLNFFVTIILSLNNDNVDASLKNQN